MKIEQIRSVDGTGALAYLIIDETNNLSALIDPNKEDVEKIIKLADSLKIKITDIIDTHTHADHITGADELRKHFNAKVHMHEATKNKSEVLKNAAKFGIEDTLQANVKVQIDNYVNENDIIKVGDLELKVLHTPGHTDNHLSILIEDAVFTGDLLLIGQAGRSDLPGGNSSDQYDSLFNKIIPLPPNTKIYPGHDYEENEFAFLKDELISNPFLQKRTKEEYIEFVADFFPPFAETTGEGGKMTLQCGIKRVETDPGGYESIQPQQLAEMMDAGEELFLLDVRQPFELIKRGKIDGVINIPLGELRERINELPQNKSQKIVCICATGNRSSEASDFLVKKGYKNIMNLEGGTYAWLNYNFQSANK
jgi:sulfur dioxygenase